MKTVSAREANQNFSKLLKRAADGEKVVITRRGKPVARLEPVAGPEQDAEPMSSATPEELSERHLTREEVMRLLDKLAELEAQGEALQAQLREARRVSVARDW